MNLRFIKIEPTIPVIYCALLAFIPYSLILGYWESHTVFHTFAPEQFWLNTIIHPRANIAGYEYAP